MLFLFLFIYCFHWNMLCLLLWYCRFSIQCTSYMSLEMSFLSLGKFTSISLRFAWRSSPSMPWNWRFVLFVSSKIPEYFLPAFRIFHILYLSVSVALLYFQVLIFFLASIFSILIVRFPLGLPIALLSVHFFSTLSWVLIKFRLKILNCLYFLFCHVFVLFG